MHLVQLKRIRVSAQLPFRATKGSAYYDLYAAAAEDIEHVDTKLITTGWGIEVPPGTFLDIRSRSGMSGTGIFVANSPGTVDEDFRGELYVILINLSGSCYHVSVGDRIAQCALMPVIPTNFQEVKELSVTARGTGGYGSSGR